MNSFENQVVYLQFCFQFSFYWLLDYLLIIFIGEFWGLTFNRDKLWLSILLNFGNFWTLLCWMLVVFIAFFSNFEVCLSCRLNLKQSVFSFWIVLTSWHWICFKSSFLPFPIFSLSLIPLITTHLSLSLQIWTKNLCHPSILGTICADSTVKSKTSKFKSRSLVSASVELHSQAFCFSPFFPSSQPLPS